MARGLGELVVRLGLDASEFTAGFNKAERDAQQFAQRVNAAIVQVGKVIGSLELGHQFLSATKDIISSASALQDLSAVTGSSVESLSKLSNQAQISGTSFETLKILMGRFAAGMGGGGKETERVTKALEFLGIAARDPATAIQEIAKKLDTFADGAGKAAIARDLFGKGGEQFLSVLKDIATAAEVSATITTKQAEEAQRLEQSFRRLSVEATTFRNAILSDVVPALNNAIEQFVVGTRVAGGFLEAIRLFGTLNPFDSVATGLSKVRKEIDLLEADQAQGGLRKSLNDFLGVGAGPKLEDAKKQLEFLKLLQRQQANALISPANDDTRDIRSRIKPELDFKNEKDSKALKELISEAERYLQTLEKQLQGTLELNIVEQAEVAIWELEKKALSGLTEERKATIRDYAAQILASQDAKKAADEARKAEEEAGRIRARISQDTTRRIQAINQEAQHIRDSNDAIQQQIAFLKGGEAGLRAFTDAKLAKTIAENLDKEAMLANAGATEAEIDAVHKVTIALRETQASLIQLDIAKKFAEDKKAAEDFANFISDSFSNAFEGFITGTKSAKDAFKSFAADIESMLVKLALKNLMNSILGIDSKGPDAFSVIAKLLGSLGGAGAAAGTGYELGSLATGTDNWRGGPTWVGERGPEIVNLPRGASVTPIGSARKASNVTQVFNVNVMPGANAASVRQTKAMLRDAVMDSARDR